MRLVNLFEWSLTVRPAQLPVAPFPLFEATTVVDAPLWLAAVQADIRVGPRSCRLKTGVLFDDMRRLRELVKE